MTRIQTNSFATWNDAVSAQSALRCAACGSTLKIHQRDGMWLLLCARHPLHRHLREPVR